MAPRTPEMRRRHYPRHRATMVTALMDLNRPGRGIETYLPWLRATLQLNAPFVVYTDDALVPRVMRMLWEEDIAWRVRVVACDLNATYYGSLVPRMRAAFATREFQTKMSHPNRYECVNPLYNVIMYSKFEWMVEVATENVFGSEEFYWIDAGLWRFYAPRTSVEDPSSALKVAALSNTFLESRHAIVKAALDANRVLVHGAPFLLTYPPAKWNSIWWVSLPPFAMGLFAGTLGPLTELRAAVRWAFNEMLARNAPNNEQLAMGLVWRTRPELVAAWVPVGCPWGGFPLLPVLLNVATWDKAVMAWNHSLPRELPPS